MMGGLHNKNTMKGIPNFLSMCRVFIIPALVILLLFHGKAVRAIAAILFVLASITDYFDGYLARRYNVVSSIGKFLDPTADKVLVMAVLVMLIPEEGWFFRCIVVIILGREIIVNSLRGAASAKGVVIEAEELGKYKTILQIFALTGLLLHYPYFLIDFHMAGMYFLLAAMILGLWSGVDYFKKFWAVALKEDP